MSLRVLRVSGMPHDVQAWLTEQDGQQTLCVDERLTVNEVAQLLEGTLKVSPGHWHDAGGPDRR